MRISQRTRLIFAVLLCVVAVGLSPQAATAAIISTTGTIVFEPNPLPGPSDTDIFAFDEQQNVTFVASQSLDAGYSIAPGTSVNSHYIQFDPVETVSRVDVGLGTVTFDGAIIGVISSTSRLTRNLPEVSMTADDYFGLTGQSYAMGINPNDRGTGGVGDSFSVSGDTLTIQSLRIPGADAGNVDAIRVLTVPEPATGVLVAALTAIMKQRRRRRAFWPGALTN